MSDLFVNFPKPCDEAWDAMTPRGCNRHCASCDTIVHDLEHMTLEEAEHLLDNEVDACVRARVGPDGVVAFQPTRRGTGRRLVAAAGASLTLATAACQTTPMADPSTPGYRITGSFFYRDHYRTAQLRSSDGQSIPRRREQGTNRFVFEGLSPGTYELTVKDSCGNRVLYQTVTVVDASIDLAPTYPEEGCIIVGAMLASDRPSMG
ncbi:hypothetical protein [Porphyrobacter sp. YT40]|uniref:hypothetical protein n=1 Tax=Porphyrobacter sp. YT40 TaxID=2547601 RepID=UPI001141EF3E|nr:hypothetical protein [Porphyrobacter sp. YT40]QDH34855.1 hypothetical protein E2E27_11290 [Porphyrobacter sp. YT40]